jgi:hypothetical protein
VGRFNGENSFCSLSTTVSIFGISATGGIIEGETVEISSESETVSGVISSFSLHQYNLFQLIPLKSEEDYEPLVLLEK